MSDKFSKQEGFDSVEDMFLDMGIDIDELEAIEQAKVDIANGDVVDLSSVNW